MSSGDRMPTPQSTEEDNEYAFTSFHKFAPARSRIHGIILTVVLVLG
jgi:hypothetical protein